MSGKVFALGTFNIDGGPRWPGMVIDEQVYRLGDLAESGSPLVEAGSLLDILDRWADLLPAMLDAAANTRSSTPVAGAVAHLPFTPRQFIGAADNYGSWGRSGAAQDPALFVGLHSAIAGPARVFRVGPTPRRVWPGVSLAVVIGWPARHVKAADALGHVAGYMLANDMTDLDVAGLHSGETDWSLAKGAPGFKVLGPLLTPAAFVPDPQVLDLRLKLDGSLLQEIRTSTMRSSVADLIERVSASVLLSPGDVVLTGTAPPQESSASSCLKAGSVIEAEASGLSGLQRILCDQ